MYELSFFLDIEKKIIEYTGYDKTISESENMVETLFLIGIEILLLLFL